MAEDLDPALVEGQKPADEPDERGLAAAVCAKQAVDLASLQPDRDVFNGDDRRLAAIDLETLGGVFNEERRRTLGQSPDCRPAHRRRLSRIHYRDAHGTSLVGGLADRTSASEVGEAGGSRLALEALSAARRLAPARRLGACKRA